MKIPGIMTTASIILLMVTLHHTWAQSADWPDLKLSGVVGSGRRGAATLNGQTVRVGASISNVTVVGIGKFGACLRLGNEIGFMKIGTTGEFTKYSLPDEILDAIASTNELPRQTYAERLQKRRQEEMLSPRSEEE